MRALRHNLLTKRLSIVSFTLFFKFQCDSPCRERCDWLGSWTFSDIRSRWLVGRKHMILFPSRPPSSTWSFGRDIPWRC